MSKILFYDIETRPMVVETWGLRDQNIGLNQVREWGGTLCVSAKWLGKGKVYFFSDWQDGHKGMLEGIHALWSEAEAICGYNNMAFDDKAIRGEFIKNNMEPPPPVVSIDLYKTVRNQFRFDSNKLDHVCYLLGLGSKLKHDGHELWTRVLQGDEKAQKLMERYCKQDAKLTEKLYKKMKPYIRNHPHLGDGNHLACPACGSLSAQKRGHRFTRAQKIQRLFCLDCCHWYDGASKKRPKREMAW
jgi:hypothetical protein